MTFFGARNRETGMRLFQHSDVIVGIASREHRVIQDLERPD